MSNPKRILRKASSKRGHQPSSSSSSILQSEELESFYPYSNIAADPNYSHLSPRVAELLDKGVDFKSAYLIHSLESHAIPTLPSGSPKNDYVLGVNLPKYKPTHFISLTTYHFPSIFDQPEASSSKQSEETISIYSNPLFETKEGILL